MRKRIQRPSPALVVASIALFVSLGGVGYAAATIDGADIENRTISGKKLKDRAVTIKKINKKTLSSLRGGTGPQGPPGPQGSAGPAGQTGTRGPSDAFQAATPGPVDVGDLSMTQVLTLDLPAAGSYVLSSKLYLNNDAGTDTFMECQLAAGSSTDVAATGIAPDTGEDDHRTIGNLLAVTTDAPTSATLSCHRYAGGATVATDARIVAIRVGSLTG